MAKKQDDNPEKDSYLNSKRRADIRRALHVRETYEGIEKIKAKITLPKLSWSK